MQIDNGKCVLYIKFYTKEIYEKQADKIVGKHAFKDNKNKTWTISIREVTNITYVRILNLPFETEMKLVEDELKEYGEILSSSFEKWNRGYALSVKSGVRGFRMILKKPIPSYIKIFETNEAPDEADWNVMTAQVIYEGQTRTCRVCKDGSHFARNCPRKNNASHKAQLYWARGARALEASKQQTLLNEKEFPPLPKHAETEQPNNKQQTAEVGKDVLEETQTQETSPSIIENTQQPLPQPPPPPTIPLFNAAAPNDMANKKRPRNDDENGVDTSQFESLKKAVELNKEKKVRNIDDSSKASNRSSRSSSRSRASSTSSIGSESSRTNKITDREKKSDNTKTSQL